MSDTDALSNNQPAVGNGPAVSLGGLELRLDLALQTESTEYTLAGQLNGNRAERFLNGGSLLIQNEATGLAWEAFFAGDGRFSLALVLVPNCDSRFIIALCDSRGEVTATVPIRISHRSASSSAADATPATQIVPRALAVELRSPDGKRRLHVLVPAGAVVPGRFSCMCRTTDQCGRVVVPLWEESRLLHQLVVGELDPNMPPGVPVDVELHVHAGRGMTLRVLVRQAGRGEMVQLPAPEPPGQPSAEEQQQQMELAKVLAGYPPLQRLTQLVKKCLFEAANLADRTRSDRQQLFALVYVQEQAAEQARAEGNAALYRECFDNLRGLAADFERMQRELLLPSRSEVAREPTIHEVQDDLKDLQAYLAVVLRAAEFLGKPEIASRLRLLDGQRQELADRAKRDICAAWRDVRRALAEVADIEQPLTGGRLGAAAAIEGMVEVVPAASPPVTCP